MTMIKCCVSAVEHADELCCKSEASSRTVSQSIFSSALTAYYTHIRVEMELFLDNDQLPFRSTERHLHGHTLPYSGRVAITTCWLYINLNDIPHTRTGDHRERVFLISSIFQLV